MKKKQEQVSPKGNSSHFKLSSTAKCVMALQYTDSQRAAEYKRAMISAEVSQAANKKKQHTRADTKED
jgi:hypothetical protein